MARYSPQRELIKSILKNTDTHPTAAEVYKQARKVMPNISLGTVYRNLEQLELSGEIISFKTDDIAHYDATVCPHAHFSCKKCKKVMDIDVDMSNLPLLPKEYAVDNSVLLFSGICPECNK